MPGRTGRVNPVKNDLYEAWAWRSTALTADQRGRWRCAVCGTGQARRTSQREVFALKLIDQHSAERRPAGLGPSGQAAACAARAVDCRTPALVAQRIEHLTTDQKVGGSSPSERATAPQVRVHFQAWPTPRVTAQEPVFSQFLTALKPSPYLIQQAISGLSAPPAECVLIGDFTTDMQAAALAGTASIGYANEPGKPVTLAAAGATTIVSSLAEIVLALRARPLPN